MAQLDEQKRVLEEWLQLPESRRRHATDVVAFAYRLLRERPELLRFNKPSGDPAASQSGNEPASGEVEARLETIVNWLLPHLKNLEPG